MSFIRSKWRRPFQLAAFMKYIIYIYAKYRNIAILIFFKDSQLEGPAAAPSISIKDLISDSSKVNIDNK